MHPFQGGETHARIRLAHLLTSGFVTTYNGTRNKLLDIDATSKLSGYLALGSITSRQINTCLIAFEDGLSIPETEDWKGAPGFGGGENEGTKLLRAELLWRDYMHLSARKFGHRLFRLEGFKDVEGVEQKWARPDKPVEGLAEEQVTKRLERFLNGTTGMGLIDASQREVYLTGYTSNRARQNTASFLVNHLSLDWRLGAEWYECVLVDYDVSSNWGNWQYVAGVGNDPRSGERILNPVKQAWDYDPRGEYIKTWVPELGGLTEPGEIFQVWTCQDETLKEKIGLKGLDLVEMPLKKIDFVFGRKQRVGGSTTVRGSGGNRGRGDGHLRKGPRGFPTGGRGRGGTTVRGLGGNRGRRGGYMREAPAGIPVGVGKKICEEIDSAPPC
jgi:deoxyribodipyrimidine photo-lyase